MKLFNKYLFLPLIALLAFFNVAKSQIDYPEDKVKWEFSLEQDGCDAIIVAKITCVEHWHVYAANLPKGSFSLPTEVEPDQSPNYKVVGKVIEPEPEFYHDAASDEDIYQHSNSFTLKRKVKILSQKDFTLKGRFSFQTCDESHCLPPFDTDFTLKVKGCVEKDVGEEFVVTNNNILDVNSSESNGLEFPEDKVQWDFSIEQSDTEATVIAKISCVDGWHIYAANLSKDPYGQATSIDFEESKNYEVIGKVIEPEPEFYHDDAANEDIYQHSKSFILKRKIKITSKENFLLKGKFGFITCDAAHCLPPYETDFEIKVRGNDSDKGDLEVNSGLNPKGINKLEITEIIPHLPNVNLDEPEGDCGDEKKSSRNVWLVFIFGFIGGLIALLTPCVFPMIPLTVSYFTKGDDDSGGIGKAILYGFFIFLIYTLLSIPFHFNADPAVLSEIATSVWLNILFFVVFIVFAISFFGYFEISLPSKLSNKADSASNVGGVLGTFFMALTLALVSFSCTGPILGTVLGSALKDGPWPITAAMSGFGIALGLPFAVFAAFPSFMNKLPKSGGWLNSVKVVLGFIEIALALKFLSNADLVEQWGLLKRETFFLIWTLVGVGLSFYLLGWIKFPHDSPIQKFSRVRMFFTVIVIGFTIYIAPGTLKQSPWNHNLLSGFPPPSFYSWYDNDSFHSEFTDFDLAMEESIKQNKPLLIDFTGWACVNCRKMEETVWTTEVIKNKLAEDFILVSLYVDDKIELPDYKQGVFEFKSEDGKIRQKKIRTIGNKWSTLQTHVFNNNSQPYYVMLSPGGYLLGNPIGYTPDVASYRDYLDCGLKAFKDGKNNE